MKVFKAILVLSVVLFVLSACKTQDTEVKKNGKMTTVQEKMDHIGCQESEIDENGNCLPAENNNTGLIVKESDTTLRTNQVTQPVQGFIAMPEADGDYPGVVMIHEWWGLNENIREMAKSLAGKGYMVFAIDLYDGQVAQDSDKARELATAVRNNPDEAINKMKQAVAYLKEQGATKIASLGWCFGGQQSLNLSLNEDLDATVIYYGQLTEDKNQLRSVSGPVLGIFGGEDTSIPVVSVRNFETLLNELRVRNKIVIYPGVGHAFANPSGSNYAESETKDAWQKTLDFLRTNLKEDASTEMATAEVVFKLSGKNYRFVMDGSESPDLRVKKGDKVRIEFTSTEGYHDWVVDEFDAATERVTEGASSSVEFVADQTGTFEYYCSVDRHRANGMRGNLIVEE